MKYTKAFLITAVAYFAVDLLVRMIVLGPLSQAATVGITRPMPEVNMQILMLEYVLVPFVLVYLLLQTPAKGKPLSYSFKLGSVLGLGIFGVYEIVNSALLVRWVPATSSVLNAVGGVVIVALSAVVATWALKKFNSK
jgi:uncharacterized membrane protein